jgi:hypothetical protein
MPAAAWRSASGRVSLLGGSAGQVRQAGRWLVRESAGAACLLPQCLRAGAPCCDQRLQGSVAPSCCQAPSGTSCCLCKAVAAATPQPAKPSACSCPALLTPAPVHDCLQPLRSRWSRPSVAASCHGVPGTAPARASPASQAAASPPAHTTGAVQRHHPRLHHQPGRHHQQSRRQPGRHPSAPMRRHPSAPTHRHPSRASQYL